jgi:hypothetical protein
MSQWQIWLSQNRPILPVSMLNKFLLVYGSLVTFVFNRIFGNHLLQILCSWRRTPYFKKLYASTTKETHCLAKKLALMIQQLMMKGLMFLITAISIKRQSRPRHAKRPCRCANQPCFAFPQRCCDLILNLCASADRPKKGHEVIPKSVAVVNGNWKSWSIAISGSQV